MEEKTKNQTLPRFDIRTGKELELGTIKLNEPIQVDVKKIASESFPFGQYMQTADGNEYILDERGITILLFN